MKYPFALIFCAMLSACGGGGGSGGVDTAGAGLPVSGWSGSNTTDPSLSTTYSGSGSGSGIGVWRYNNTSASADIVNINIAGVSAGKTATLVFSNGSASTVSQPDSGTLASSATSAALADAGIPLGAASAHQHGQDDAHAGMLERNRVLATGLIRQRLTAAPAADLTSRPLAEGVSGASTPAVGATRSWNENFEGTPVVYSATVEAVCTLSSGRHVVWWVDPHVVSSGTFNSADWSVAFNRLQASYCGDSGGLTRITKLLGEVWGAESAFHPEYIQENSVAKQDVNVVLLDVPSSQWAGYFFGEDTKLKTSSSSSSNQALAFFINASQVANDVDFTASTLLHETTHMVNFYQRAVARGVVHDTWLEETTAMMTEDIVAPAVISGYNKALSERLPVYRASGGDVSYINWPKLTSASAHYGMGAGFGAFLNRRYGLSIYQQLVDSCGNGVPATSTLSSQECLDGLIRANQGAGFGDEFARFGTTLFGRFPAVGAPSGYGYPAKTAGGYSLQAKDLSALPLVRPATPTSGYQATSHLFRRDTISAGSSYVRNNVVVPANTSLTVIIQ
ncbi:MAG: hypothetical protein NTZ64_10680 [Polaromonas sp.]|nr:hypothetical protein [Polaromonas sp.]